MHIKKITIQGFKTYKNATVVDDLSPNCNVVVGRNGSGKSNFFAAIRFVLSDAYTHMTREERQALIHDGSGTVMSAYVEIVFDNTDGRFPIAKSEILIRRTIGMKKDDYSLDGKSATRSDIMNLLESAGFSRSNPYYIVPQGRITSLTNSKDHERLTLLKEVSGATVFESKLKESVKEMNQSTLKRQRIDEALDSINEKISDLQIESDDLKEFQSLEKQKKVLEYNIFDREFNELNESISELEERHQQLMTGSQKDLNEMEQREKLCSQLQTSINELKVSLRVLSLEKEQTDLDCNQMLKHIAEKEIKVNELKAKLDTVDDKSTDLDEQIETHKLQIKQQLDLIAKDKPQLIEMQKRESELKQQLSELHSKQRALYSKQNRFSKFENKEKRDSWLTTEISKLKKQVKEKEQDVKQISNELKSKTSDGDSCLERIHKLESLLQDENHSVQITSLKNSIQSLKLKINQCVDQRKSLWRDEIRLKSVFDSVTNDFNNASDLVNRTMDRAQAQGIAAVKWIAKKLNLEKNVYGTVAELFHVNDKYKVATEVIAGTSLFHVVVDTDATAALLIEELIRTKAGRVTFVPLNRIENTSVSEYPDSQENQCLPLISKLKYNNETVGKAINQIFGKALVVNELQRGAELSRKFKLTCITLDGDRVDTKGVLSGGYRDYKTSRIDAMKLQTKKRNELTKTEAEMNKVSQEISNINQEMTNLNNELQLNIRDLDKLEGAKEPLEIELSQLKAKKFNIDEEISVLKSNLESLQSAKNILSTNLKQFEKELNSDFTQSLSKEEVGQLELYNSKLAEIERELDDVVTSALELDTRISGLENDAESLKLSMNLLIQEKQSLGDKLFLQQEYDGLNQELESLQMQLDTAQSRNDQVSENYDQIIEEVNENEKSLERANEQQIATLKNFEKFSKSATKLLNQKSIKEQTRDEVNKKIRELGMLPEEAFQPEKFDRFNSNDLVTQLNKVNDQLTKYSHINKKAMEQYNQFTKQRDELNSRKEELDESKKSIEELIANLQQQKKEAIMNSFKQVAKAFHEIFEKLVPQGVGYLELQKKSLSDTQTQTQHQNEDGEEEGEDDSIDNYTGVSISVSFNSKNDEQQKIEQLSGGQKSLCAIALIFAIQHCDPAPFYLFDEIDSNLDTQYRTSVASLIKSLSADAQFICTTFRSELLSLAGNKFYGVVFNNKVSSIVGIDKEDAMNFVEGQVNN
ncbi:Smc3 protein [Candida orthopsilosis Co 90-125]|uniref:Structural maintenance of chromosomes protein n=1 Tax=Candida orthopsilosis (strain 90-125) TaxID=1136231 RepID=H8X110_CANO9|nr:Smc3 protein [Candida orthopsilosis Co 90-125]CCG22050.1 Smc3 protein [Candida orthopsilosis Co 90-125]